MVLGATRVIHPDGTISMTVYTADKNGFRSTVAINKRNRLLSLVGGGK